MKTVHETMVQQHSALESSIDKSLAQCKTVILSQVEGTIADLKREIYDLKSRLIKPEQTYSDFINKMVSLAKERKAMNGESLYIAIVKNEESSNAIESLFETPQTKLEQLISTELQTLSTDTVWFFSNKEITLKSNETNDLKRVTQDLLKQVITHSEKQIKETAFANGKFRNYQELIEMVYDLVNREMIGEDTILQWLCKKVKEAPQLDTLTSNLLSNMVSSVVDELAEGNCVDIHKNEVEFETIETYSEEISEEFLIEQLKSILVKNAQEINSKAAEVSPELYDLF